MTNDEINRRFAEKVARGIFRPVIRHITGSDPEERLAEAVALTFELYSKKARAGVELDDAVLVHYARRRAVDLGRQFVRSGQRKRDALDPRNYHQGRVEILRIDGLPDEDGTFRREEDAEVVIGLADGLAQDPTPKIIGARDLASWAETLAPRDRAVLAERYEGHTLRETAEATSTEMAKPTLAATATAVAISSPSPTAMGRSPRRVGGIAGAIRDTCGSATSTEMARPT